MTDHTPDEESVFALPGTPAPPAGPAYQASNADAVAALFDSGPAETLPVTPPVSPPRAAPVPPTQQVETTGSMPAVAPAASTPGVQPVDEDRPVGRVVLDDLLAYVVRVGGSDLHLSTGAPPMVRLRRRLTPIPGYAPLTPQVLQDCVYADLTRVQIADFEKRKRLDLAITLPGEGRFRANIYRARGNVGAVMRHIPNDIKHLDDLNMPAIIGSFANLPRGLVLVTGQTGSGKTTTLGSIIDVANRTREHKILTIEDPIEYVHQHAGCLVDQREIGDDTDSFDDALRDALRENPDIILVGEMRDLETTRIALRAAETGHLVFSTLHTQSAQETITRVVDQFPAEQQAQIRTQLAATLKAVVCQTLVENAAGDRLLAAVEVMVCTPGISNQIREGQLHQIQSSIQTGAEHGMQTLNQHLARMALDGSITYDTALAECSNKQDFETLTGGRAAVAAAATARQQQADRAKGNWGSL